MNMLKKAGALAVLRCVNAALNVCVLIILARSIDAAGVGVYAYLVVIMTLMLIPFGNGVQTLVLKLTAEATTHGDWSEAKGAVSASIRLAFLFALSILIVLTVLRTSEFHFISRLELGVIPAVCGILLLDSLSAVRSGFLRGIDRPVESQLPELLVRPACLLIGLSAYYWTSREGIDVTGVFYLLLMSAFVASITGFRLALRALPDGFRTADPRYRRQWVSSASSFAAKGGAAVMNSYVDILLLGILIASSADVGIYRVAGQIAVVSGIGYVSINAITMQVFAVQQARGDLREIRTTARQSARMALAASLPMLVIMGFFGEELVSFIFGPEFADAAWIAVILLAGQAINSGFGTVASLLTVSDRGWIVTRWFTYAAATNAVFCLALIPVFGTAGAASANVIAALLLNAALWTIAKFQLGVDTSAFGR